LRQVLAVSPQLAKLPPEELDRYSTVLLIAHTPGDPLGTHLVMSHVEPGGFCWSRRTLASIPHRHLIPLFEREFRFKRTDRDTPGWRISCRLAPAAGAKPGTLIGRSP